MRRKKESRIVKMAIFTAFILCNVILMVFLSLVLTHNYQTRKQIEMCERSISKGQNYAPNCFFGDEYNYYEWKINNN